ncbi:MAG: hypothetical protein HYU38_04305, partial [Candidatus Tectomicrobia bacterium]|nr:hypothetical protein [Candidatus Tectomicrobia bacterium]
RPGLRVVLSTVTDTGREAASRVPGAEAAFYLPFDFPFAVRRALGRVRPSALALIETELWPNLIRLASGGGIPVAVVNGRLSERSFRGYRRFFPLFGSPVEELSGVAAREEGDARRFQALGARRVLAAGNLKYDAFLPAEPGEGLAAYGFEAGAPVIVAGSTHPGEGAAVARALRGPRERHPRLGLLVAPRHLPRVDEAEAVLRAEGLAPVRWSAWSNEGGGRPAPGGVVLLDVMGRLAGAYEGAALAFIGGRGGAIQVEGPHALGMAFEGWLADPAARGRAGEAAQEVVKANQGAAARTTGFLLDLLGPAEGLR